jgi:hypothetical protein
MFLEYLSNRKEFKFTTLRALDDVNSPRPNYPNGKFPPIRGALEDVPGILVSIRSMSRVSSCDFLFS